MHSVVSSLAAIAAIALPLCTAQTSTACNPMDKTCLNSVGLNQAEYTIDLTKGVPDNWTMTSGELKTSSLGGLFQINTINDGPTLQSNFHIFFGYVEMKMQAAPGAGIVSTFVMESQDLDEIDLEIIGSQTTQVQSNYFGKGNTTTYDRGQFHPVTTPQTTVHTYAVDWQQDKTVWYIDGQAVRTLNFADAVGGKNYPQTPLNLRIGNWVAGQPKNDPGTVEWAGGMANMADAPFNMYVSQITIKNYNPCASYEYSDKTGSYQSIKCTSDSAASGSSSSSASAPSASSSAGASSGGSIASKSSSSLSSTGRSVSSTPA
ncbi:concanavalin A-like lectin/glucanase, partial [Rhizodiscina lignyota]